MKLRQRAILSLALMVLGCAAESAAGSLGPRVYIVLIDGLGADQVAAERSPTLWRLAHSGTFYPHGHAVMPTLTNPNHASIVTGVYVQAHGIIANRGWADGEVAALDQSTLIEAQTIFTLAATSPGHPRTAGIFGKAKLARLFASAETQHAPDPLWGDADEESGAGSDRRTMDEVLRTIVAEDPAFVFVNLGDVDRRSHAYGPASPQVTETVAEADRQIARLVALLEERKLTP